MRIQLSQHFGMLGVIRFVGELIAVDFHVVKFLRPVVVPHQVPIVGAPRVTFVERQGTVFHTSGRGVQNRHQASALQFRWNR